MALSRRTDGVESARKALHLLLHFDESHVGASVAELATATGQPLSSVYRHVALLRELGLLEQGRRGQYHVSARVYGLTRAADAAGGLIVRARPVLHRLAALTGETAVLVRLLGDAAVAVDQVESNPPIRLAYSPGRTMPLTAGAPAKMLLASLPASSRTAYLDRLSNLDAAFARRRADWNKELTTARQQDWAESFGEVDRGLWGVSAPIRLGGHVVAALSLAGPLDRLDDSGRRKGIKLCCDCAVELTEALAADAAARTKRNGS